MMARRSHQDRVSEQLQELAPHGQDILAQVVESISPDAVDRIEIPSASEPTAPSGKRQALRDLRRQLKDDELANPGVQKLLLDALESKDAECEALSSYVQRFHEADKRASVLDEKMKTHSAIEIGFGVGVGIGGVIIGLAPVYWNQQPMGTILLIVGALLIIGGSVMKLTKP